MDCNKHYIIDSRSLTTPQNTVFVAIHTQTGNGHDHLQTLYDKGVREFIISSNEHIAEMPEAKLTFAENTVDYLQFLAAERRHAINAPVVAITGSRGKTIVKEWLHFLTGKNTERSPRSFNSQLGVPLSLLNMNLNDRQPIVVEAGISRSGEMEKLRNIINPDLVVLTSLTNEHSRELGTLHDAAHEKLKLAQKAKAIVFPSENAIIAAELQNTTAVNPNIRLITWHIEHGILSVEEGSKKYFSISTKQLASLNPIFENFWTVNDLGAALGAAAFLNENLLTEVNKHLSDLQPISTRLKVEEGAVNNKIIVDFFTSDALSLVQTFDFARRIATDKQNIHLLFMAQKDRLLSQDELDKIKIEAGKYGITNVNVILPEELSRLNSRSVRREFFKQKGLHQIQDSTVIINSSPHNRALPLVLAGLETRQHETILEINLDAIVSNLKYFKSHLRPSTGIICMLKAFGYGTGSIELAKTLQTQGVAAVAVAVVDEGVELRKHGVTCPVIVLNPRAQSLDTMIDYKLEPAIYNFDMLDKIGKMARNKKADKLPVHLKIETGMGRLGFVEAELHELISRLADFADCLTVDTIFSHLATADCLDMDSYTLRQIELFEHISQRIIGTLGYRIKRHILNSAGILRFPQYQFDLVRLGIGLYGIQTLPREIESGLFPVASLFTTIISLKHWPAGTSIGYGRRGILAKDSIIATLPVGYADGIDRRMGNGHSHMLVKGVKCPTVGNICMDICMIDVSAVPDCQCGHRVEIFGENIPMEEVATQLETIPYEILTSISQRVKREYFHE